MDDWEALVRQVKEANDIVEVVGMYVTLRPAGNTFKGLCPFHDDRRPSFDVDPRRQRYRCWSCGKHGDVISFIQEQDRVNFREALEILARRASISLEKTRAFRPNSERAAMIELMRWADERYQRCLHASPLAARARAYLAERGLADATIQRFGLGFAPNSWDWLVAQARREGRSLDMLVQLGLCAPRSEGEGFYDRFRDRIMFPIRNAQGQTVGFGGRILPDSPASERGPKYYNSSETPLFSKSELLFGLDQARQSAAQQGCLVIVEGYTDVMMAHQMGINHVVATMGTALNARHIRQLRRYVPRVVLVFDADAGGMTGVDRALELFVSHDLELAIATLPAGLDPCDLLLAQGADAFREVLAKATDALEFKLEQVLSQEDLVTVESRRRAIDNVLRVLAQAPEMAGHEGAVKRELIINRIAQRLGMTNQEKVLWDRLRELRSRSRAPVEKPAQQQTETRAAPAAEHEKQLVQILLASPELVGVAQANLALEEIEHPGLRRLVQILFDLHKAGEPVGLDRLRERVENQRLGEIALQFAELGRMHPDCSNWLRQILGVFEQRRYQRRKQQLQSQLLVANDHTEAVELLRQLQNK
ncbi:MAG: DNA primase [Gemmatales bacterium]|nr:MAG: DNA primase [Gemmatales bacterium]